MRCVVWHGGLLLTVILRQLHQLEGNRNSLLFQGSLSSIGASTLSRPLKESQAQSMKVDDIHALNVPEGCNPLASPPGFELAIESANTTRFSRGFNRGRSLHQAGSHEWSVMH